MRDYKGIFEGVEATLIEIGSRAKSRDEIQASLDEYKHFEGKLFSDEQCFRKLVHIIFYAGFTAATVTRKIPVLNSHFPSYSTVAEYNEKDIQHILQDAEMIRNDEKIRACVANARTFRSIVGEYAVNSRSMLIRLRQTHQ